MLAFYRKIIWTACKEFYSAFGDSSQLATLLFSALLLFNKSLGQRAMNTWNGISPWWASFPIAALFLFRMLKANYQNFAKLEVELRNANAKINLIKPFVSASKYQKGKSGFQSGLVLTNPKYAAYAVKIPPVQIVGCPYTMSFDGTLAQLHDYDKEVLLESKLGHDGGVGTDGGQLHTILQNYDIRRIDFPIIYKNDSRTWYVTWSYIVVDQSERDGLRVGYDHQDIIEESQLEKLGYTKD